jgi:hypothetical protein
VPTIEYYLQHADDLAQKILDDWEASTKPVSPEFQGLFDRASQYLIARRVADKRHTDPALTGPDHVEENAARAEFAEAYKRFDENRKAAKA